MSPTTPTPEPPTSQPQPTAASAWRSPRQEGQLVTLPSGNVARLRRSLDILTLIKSGRIPNPLRGVIEESIRSGGDAAKFDTSKLQSGAMEQFAELLDATLVKCMIEPPVQAPPDPPQKPEGDDVTDADTDAWLDEMTEWEQWEPDPGYISTNDVDIEDKMFVFAVAQGGAADLRSFRELQAPGLASVQNGQGVQHDTKQPSGTG